MCSCCKYSVFADPFGEAAGPFGEAAGPFGEAADPFGEAAGLAAGLFLLFFFQAPFVFFYKTILYV